MNHPTDDQGLLQEIEEDLQRQKLEALWKKYGSYFLGGALLIVLATASVTGWKTHHESTVRQRTEAYADTLAKDYDKPDERLAALKNFAAVHDGTTQAFFAKLQESALLAQSGQTEQAAASYDAIAADASVPPVYRDLATLLSVQTAFDKGDPARLASKLQPLMVENGVWRNIATEYAAHLALKAGDRQKASALFTQLTSAPDVPPEIAGRATDMLNWIKEGK